MVNHFVNLVSWRYFLECSPDARIHLDSISIRLLAKLYGFSHVPSKSGFSFYAENKHYLETSLFLTSKPIIGCHNYYVLPFWKNIEDVCLFRELEEKIKLSTSVVIGISSPKQDYLAQIIDKKFTVENIYCLGAALYPVGNLLKYDKFRINWIFMLLKDRRRTVVKLRITINEFFLILLNLLL